MKWLAIIIVVIFAYFLQLSESGCPPPKSCGPTKKCDGGLVCLNNKCRYCGCNEASECYVGADGGYACNCTGSPLTGPHCECKPAPECEDQYGLKTTCSEFSNSIKDTLKIPDVYFEDRLRYDGDGSPRNVDLTGCFNACYDSAYCRVFVFEYGDVSSCKLYNENMVSPFQRVMTKLRQRRQSDVYILKCLKCENADHRIM